MRIDRARSGRWRSAPPGSDRQVLANPVGLVVDDDQLLKEAAPNAARIAETLVGMRGRRAGAAVSRACLRSSPRLTRYAVRPLTAQ
jgi:hypothetical protein